MAKRNTLDHLMRRYLQLCKKRKRVGNPRRVSERKKKMAIDEKIAPLLKAIRREGREVGLNIQAY